jgi:ABC-type bacteriocin/lantibiotic exporter with double-glycine peptidase domain
MSGEELDQRSINHDKTVEEPILLQNASFRWIKEDSPFLNNITISINKNELIAVIGRVGSGKSSFLHSLLGNMFKAKGYVNINGSIAYVPQQAWIQNATLQQNIIYTNALDEIKLKKVIENCALTQDLDILPGGQMTEIGEKGINLSGLIISIVLLYFDC